VTHDSRESCPRCGFTVDFTGTSEKFRAKYGPVLEEHLAACPTLVSTAQYRAIKNAVRKERFLHGPDAAMTALEDGLDKIGGARS
jgi:hypothetical protein